MEKEPEKFIEIKLGPETILTVLENAIKKQEKVELTVETLNIDTDRKDQDPLRTATVIPESIENGVVLVLTEQGYKIQIELSRITMAKKAG